MPRKQRKNDVDPARTQKSNDPAYIKRKVNEVEDSWDWTNKGKLNP